MKISYCITVNDEYTELQRLYKFLRTSIRPEDEIVVQQDSRASVKGLPDTKVRAYCEELDKLGEIKYVTFDLNGHFANFKNNLAKVAAGDYIFQIDADEVPRIHLVESLPAVLEGNPDVDVYVVPRVNTVEGLTPEHIQKWRWNVNEAGWINFPDYQWRIYRNDGSITWKNQVHEVLVGHKQYAALPAEEEYCLYHPKTIEKQERQNAYYDTLG